MFTWWNRTLLASGRNRYRPHVESLESRELPAVTVSAGPVTNVSQAIHNQREQSIAVNPANPLEVVAFSNIEDINGNNAADPGLFSAWSDDGGVTWNQQFLFTDATSLDVACCDPQTAWDEFGNLWLTYLSDNGDIILALSTDSGRTFSTSLLTGLGTCDQPSIGIGPGRQRGQSAVWITYFTSTGGPHQEVLGMIVTGRGSFGVFGGARVIPGSDMVIGNFGDIAVGPNGEVMVTYQSNLAPVSGPAQIYMNVDPDGFGPQPFGPRTLVTPTNVGPARLIPGTSNNLGIDAEANLAWDRSNGPNRGRVYMVYTTAASPLVTDQNTDIFVIFSDNRGKTWSTPVLVSDITVGSQFNPAIALDQTTGFIGLTWYDTRNAPQPANNTAEVFATISDDGGLTFGTDVLLTFGASQSSLSEPPATGVRPLGFGDYTKIDFTRGVLQAVWADNSVALPGNPNPPRMEIAARRLTVTSNAAGQPAPIRVRFNNDFRVLSHAAATYSGTITVTNLSGSRVRGPILLQIRVPHPSLRILSPSATRDGDVYSIRVNVNLPANTPLVFKVKMFNPLRLRFGGLRTNGFALSLA